MNKLNFVRQSARHYYSTSEGVAVCLSNDKSFFAVIACDGQIAYRLPTYGQIEIALEAAKISAGFLV